MFWKKAHRHYSNLPPEDPDISRYLRLSGEFQEGCGGLIAEIQDMGHRWVAAHTPSGRVLEIGFGAGRHARFYRGDAAGYYISEYSERYTRSAAWGRLRGRGTRCDARSLPYRAQSFDAVLSTYNLEHILDLGCVFREVHRVLKCGGKFLVALPCEGGFAWNFGRELTTRRSFQKHYGINYDKIIAYEHVWDFPGVFLQLVSSPLFRVRRRRMFPFLVPTHHINAVACIECSAV